MNNLEGFKKYLNWFLIAIAIIAIVYSYYIGDRIHFSKQWPLFDALRSTSSIVFGIVGAWMALVYPRAVKFIIKHRKSDNVESMAEIDDVEILLKPLLLSSAVLVVLIFIGPLADGIKSLHMTGKCYEVARRISFSTLVTLSIVQVRAIILTLVPIYKIKRIFRDFKRDKEARNKFN